jgi:hypothetical protein
MPQRRMLVQSAPGPPTSKIVQGGPLNRGKKCTFSIYRPASFTYAFGSPEKVLMVYVWTLAANLSKKNVSFPDGDVQAATQR